MSTATIYLILSSYEFEKRIQMKLPKNPKLWYKVNFNTVPGQDTLEVVGKPRKCINYFEEVSENELSVHD